MTLFEIRSSVLVVLIKLILSHRIVIKQCNFSFCVYMKCDLLWIPEDGFCISMLIICLFSEHPEVFLSKSQYVCEGVTVTLSCNATGKPPPNITWTKVEENGPDSRALPSVDGFYVISDIKNTSNGTYRCTASNRVGYPVNQTTVVNVGSK